MGCADAQYTLSSDSLKVLWNGSKGGIQSRLPPGTSSGGPVGGNGERQGGGGRNRRGNDREGKDGGGKQGAAEQGGRDL